MYYTKEQIERANQQSITEFFRSNGYSCERKGREMHIHGFGGMKVDEVTQKYYIFSRQVGGVGLVDCLKKAFDLKFPEAVSMALNGEQPYSLYSVQHTSYAHRQFPNGELPQAREKPVKEFIMPAKGNDNKRVFAYLTKQRCISPKIVSELINANLLYQDDKGNAVFLDVKDSKPCGAEFHGTGSKKYMIGNTKFSDIENRQILKVPPYIAEKIGEILKDETQIKFVGYVYETEANIAASAEDIMTISGIAEAVKNSVTDIDELNNAVRKKLKSLNGTAAGTADNFFEYKKSENPEKAYVFESAIDMMSFMHLHPDTDNCEFVSMGGLKLSTVETLLHRNLKVVLCVDNDEAGKNFCKNFLDICMVFTECHKNGVKDFNELLQRLNPKKNFTDTVQRMSQWSDRVQQKVSIAREAFANDRNQSFKAKYVR